MSWLTKVMTVFGRRPDDDTRGAPPPPGLPAPRPTEAVGVSGTPIYGGFILSPERHASLTGIQKYRTFDEDMLNVPVVGAAVRFFVTMVVRAGWKVEAPEDSGDAGVEVAERFDDVMHDMTSPWHAVVQRAAMYKYRGFVMLEWTAKLRPDGVVGLLDVEQRPQHTIERWDVDATGTVRGVWQRDPQSGAEIYLPRSKLVYLVDDMLTDSPDGVGLMRHVVEPCRKIRRYEQLEGQGYETDLRGVPVGRAPWQRLSEDARAGVTGAAATKAAVEQSMAGFARNHVRGLETALVLDSEPHRNKDGTISQHRQYDVELLKGGGTSQADVHQTIERLNREVARVLGGEHLLLGADGKGSMALAKVKTEMLALSVDSVLRTLAWVFRADLVKPWAALNGIPDKMVPVLKPDSTQFRDVEQMAAVFRDMAVAGLDPRDPAHGELRDLMGVSRMPQELVDEAEEASLAGREMQRLAAESSRRGGEDDEDDDSLAGEDMMEEDE